MSKVKIFLNGEEKLFESGLTIKDLVNFFELDVKKIAIEKDLKIIAAQDFEKEILQDGSKVEIVHFIGGG